MIIKQLVSNRELKKLLKQSKGFCPLSRNPFKPITEEDKCQCKDFRDKINDPTFFGKCGCGLFEKVED